MLKRSFLSISMLCLFVLIAGVSAIAAIKPIRQRCEYLVNPLAVDAGNPRLSWEIDGGQERNLKQTSYQIQAASSIALLDQNRPDLWDSGRINSSETNQIEYKGKLPGPGKMIYWRVRVTGNQGPASSWSPAAFWGQGIDVSQATWIGSPTPSLDDRSATYLRKEFVLQQLPPRVLVYASALGCYELRINGKRVGDHFLAPEFTDYNIRAQYQAYDVTSLLLPGKNVIAGIIGDGWYAGGIGLSQILIKKPRNIYGQHPRLFVELRSLAGNTSTRLLTGDESWKTSRNGAIRSSDLLDGEVYDARLSNEGWDLVGFNDSKWDKASAIPNSIRLVPQPNEPVKITREIKPAAMKEVKPGTWVYDMGQNMVGWCRLTASGSRGDEVVLRFAEMLNDDGTVYIENLRGAQQTDKFILSGKTREQLEPHFTYHGFRYVEVTGLKSKPDLGLLTGQQLNSSMRETGSFESSSDLLNKLWSNVIWTQRDNMIGIPTDCPQRDERLGWTGDIQVFSGTSIFNMDMGGFFTKWLQDMRDDQTPDGRFPDFAPQPFQKALADLKRGDFMGVPGWGDAGVVVPWRMYQQYGDQRILAHSYDSAVRWVEFIRGNNPDLLWKNKRHNDYGDWLNSDTMKHESIPRKGGEMPKPVFATAMFAYATDLVAQMAHVLGKKDDELKYRRLFEDIKASFNKAYVKPDGRIEGNTQAGYALALHFNLLPEPLRARAVDYMLEGINAYGGHMSTGFHSTYRMMLELSRAGHSDIAYQLINQRTFPSWGYSIENGATTIWERWDGFVKGRGFQDKGMNSFNHYAIGAVAEWMYRVILGINNDDSRPGYEHSIIHPIPGGGLKWAKGEYQSIRGPISTSWEDGEASFKLRVTIPANSSATVILPFKGKGTVFEGGKPISASRTASGELTLETGSGSYDFIVK